MYAIVEIAGKQYKVEKDATVHVDRLSDAKEDVSFDTVVLLADGEKVQVGQPYLKNVTIKAKNLGDVKGEKVRGVKFKKRKNYTRTIGHRQRYTQLKISDLVVS